MKLQIAFNSIDLEQDLAVAKAIHNFADQIEIGPLPLYKYGITAIQKFREALPQNDIVADTKIIEFGKESTMLNLDAGADWVTVLAGSNKNIIHSACTAAHNLNKKVILDLIDSRSRGQSALEAKSYGVDAILFHQPYDDHDPLALMDDWDMVKGNTDLPIYISAKISRDTIQSVIDLNPHGISIGKAITQAEDPATEAEYFKQLLG